MGGHLAGSPNVEDGSQAGLKDLSSAEGRGVDGVGGRLISWGGGANLNSLGNHRAFSSGRPEL
jgi:hypothetical protein